MWVHQFVYRGCYYGPAVGTRACWPSGCQSGRRTTPDGRQFRWTVPLEIERNIRRKPCANLTRFRPAAQKFPGRFRDETTTNDIGWVRDASAASARLHFKPAPVPIAILWPAISCGGRRQGQEFRPGWHDVRRCRHNTAGAVKRSAFAAHATRFVAIGCDGLQNGGRHQQIAKSPQIQTECVVVRDLPHFHGRIKNGAAGTRTQNQQIMSLLL